jgi:hypothetical protein
MGINDRVQDKKDARRKSAEAKRKLRDRSGHGGQVADWMSADGTLLAAFIAAVSRDGGAARFGYTRDGGAYAVGIYGDGDPYTVYITPKEDLNDWLRESTADFSRS